MHHRWRAAILVLVSAILGACEYDVPITAKPTQKIEARLLGDWTGMDGSDKVEMQVAQYDDSTYVVSYNGDLLRVFHSTVAGTPF